MEKENIIDWIDTPEGKIPRVSSELTGADRRGTFKVRLGFGRMNYKVDPGLYALGNPGKDSIVLVSANYKLSFDSLRKELTGLDAWILVLDTKGINVWCAAGKGTFGTLEIVHRVEATGLRNVVDHRNLLLPQLGAPGVSAHGVKKFSGFTVIYGPVRAVDIDAFLKAGMTATKEMRTVRFSFYDRLLLLPIEITIGFKYLLIACVIFFLLSALLEYGLGGGLNLTIGIRSVVNLSLAFLAGAVLGPLLLPWLPGRRFSLKGFFSGAVLFLFLLFAGLTGSTRMETAAWLLIITAISSFLTMNFTGASTYTSLSGVRKEMRFAVPLQIMAAVAGLGLWIGFRFI